MPSTGKQEATDHLSESYKNLLLEREILLKQRSKRLGKKAFIELNEKQQLEYCGLNKRLMENYWQEYETAKADTDYQLAAQDFQKSLEMGFSKAIALFLGKKPNTALKSKKTFSLHSDNNLIKGLRFHLGLRYPQNQEEAVHFYTKAAEQGNAAARFLLGLCYEKGIGVDKNKEEAVKWYRLAAEQGHALAQNNLGDCYFSDIGVGKNKEEAVKWYRLAAEQGHALAQDNLGYCYQHSFGVDQDEKEAVKWYRLAAEQGHPQAQNNLGYCYQNGIGADQDEQKAVKLFRLGAEKGNSSAQNNLGISYDEGTGIDKDEKKAVKWYKLAAEKGNASAQNNLGVSYVEGTGVDKDEKEAVKWFRLAAKQGYARALRSLKTLESPLAKYTIALLEMNYSAALEIALSEETIQAQFYEHDFIPLIKGMNNKDDIRTFLANLQDKAQRFNKNFNTSLTSALLSLDEAINTHLIEGNEDVTFLLSGLLDLMNLADAEASQVKELMHFLCNLYNKENAQEVLHSLMKLWYRAQALDVRMDDSGLNRLIATRIVSHLFDDNYSLKFTPDFDRDDLIVLVCAYEKQKPFTVEQLNPFLSEPLLVDSKYHPKNLFPRLKACLVNPRTWNGDTSLSLSKIIEQFNEKISDDKPLNDDAADQLASELRKYAKHINSASKVFGFFATDHSKELQLARIIKTGENEKLLEWIDAPIEQNACTATALDM